MDRYLGGEEIDIEMLIDDLETAVARGTFYPVRPGLRRDRRRPGRELLELLTAGVPVAAGARRCRSSPGRTARPRPPLTCDPDGPLVAEVVKTTIDPYVGRVSPGPGLLRHAAPRQPRARVGPRAWPSAATRTTTSTSGSARCPRRSARRSATVAECIAGDICAITKLGHAPRPATPCRPRTTRC